jgi:spore coat protein CotH
MGPVSLAKLLTHPINLLIMASLLSVILNDKPIGLFLLVDQLDKTWLRAAYGAAEKKAPTGILYMGNRVLNGHDGRQYMSDLSYLGDDQSLYGVNDTYLLKQKSSDKQDNDFTKLAEFTKQISQSDNLDVQGWNDLLDVDVFLKK